MKEKIKEYISQLFAGEYDGGAYCDFGSVAAAATAGKDWLVAIWDLTGTDILAIAGQQA